LESLEQDFHQIEVLTKMKGTLLTRVQGIKVDFLRFNYPTVRPVRTEGNLRLLTPEDIAPMKLEAIAGSWKRKKERFLRLRNIAIISSRFRRGDFSSGQGARRERSQSYVTDEGNCAD